MKANTITFLERMVIPAACIFTIIVLSAFVLFIIYLPYHDMFLFFSNSNYFWFNGRQIALASTTPLFIYVILYAFISLFSKKHQPPKKFQELSSIIAFSFVSIFVLINIISIGFYFYVAIFTPFKTCQEPILTNYYVTDYQICKKIVGYAMY